MVATSVPLPQLVGLTDSGGAHYWPARSGPIVIARARRPLLGRGHAVAWRCVDSEPADVAEVGGPRPAGPGRDAPPTRRCIHLLLGRTPACRCWWMTSGNLIR
jgi:hypothetical protein